MTLFTAWEILPRFSICVALEAYPTLIKVAVLCLSLVSISLCVHAYVQTVALGRAGLGVVPEHAS